MARNTNKLKSLKKGSAEEITRLNNVDKQLIIELYYFGHETQGQVLQVLAKSRVGRALKTYLKEDVVTRRGGNSIYSYSLNSNGRDIAETLLGLPKENLYRAQNVIHDAPLVAYARENLSANELRNIITEEEQKRMIINHPNYDPTKEYSACDFGYRGDDGGLYFIESEGDKYTKEMIQAKKNTAELLGGEYIGFKAREFWSR